MMMNSRLGTLVGSSVLLLALCACDDDTTALPRLTVEVFNPEHACFVLCEGTVDKAERARLGDECEAALGSRACGFQAGRDRIRLTVDYGDVEFEKAADVPAPTLSVRVNDVPLTSQPALSSHPRGRHLFFTTTLTAPAQSAESFGFAVGSAEFAASVDGFTISEPTADVSVGACQTCPLIAGTIVPVVVKIPAGLNTKTGTLILKVPRGSQGNPVPLEFTGPRESSLIAETRVTVPDEPGALLTVEAQVGSVLGKYQATIAKPTLSLQVSECTDATSCSLMAQSVATVRFAVPNDLAEKSVSLTTLTDNAVDGEPRSIPLSEREGEIALGVARLPVPDAPNAQWRLRAQVGSTAVERTIAITAPMISVKAAQCTSGTSPCTISAGVGSALVTVSAPLQVAVTSASLTWTLDDVPSGAPALPLPMQPQAEVRSGMLSVPAPDQPGREWRLVASIGRTQAVSSPIRLVPPRPIRLRLVPKDTPRDSIDFGASGVPQRTSGEPDAACRELLLAVDAPEVSQGRLTLQSNLGDINGRGAQVEVALDSQRRAYVPLSLPFEHTGSRSLQVSAQAPPQRSDVLSMPLEPVYPLAGSIVAPAAQLPVDASGSMAATLRGRLVLPPGARAVPGTPVSIIVTATAEAAAGPLACGRPVPSQALACDPTDPAATGGCLLAPLAATVDETGHYSVTLNAGICFAGEVTLEARSLRYLSGEAACLGERGVTEAQQSLGQVTVSFIPAPQ
ncbi:hypothetical protein [Hyalangium sp.]|uniref:hypothetical protein n=1 Tax=Hyalangium sp. TaxID=2028555 RepID=UPI002D4DDC58|nr:hypothetical protein [Hyalangium sp.]HYI00184.1 hypothetical protein [Hyalangium sp.]